METNFKAVVRYDGTGFDGWQVQPGRRTVQGEIEGALSRIASQRVHIHGAGRTDAGVHALGQVFSCRWPGEGEVERLGRALSGMLAPEIRIERIEAVGLEFHARKSAVSKRYAYAFSLGRYADPFSARYSWWVPWPVDLERLAALVKRVEGEHDFAGFRGSGSAVLGTVRTIHSVRLEQGGFAGPCDAEGLWRLEFEGSGFLYKMVRNLTGTLIDIARGQVAESRLDELLASEGPYRGYTAPGHGLALVEVRY